MGNPFSFLSALMFEDNPLLQKAQSAPPPVPLGPVVVVAGVVPAVTPLLHASDSSPMAANTNLVSVRRRLLSASASPVAYWPLNFTLGSAALQ